MAGDWIKMRVWLSRDPRVIRMATWLAKEPQFVNPMGLGGISPEKALRNVTVALCVTGLLVTWGTARELGDRVGDDLVLRKSNLATLDAMTDMPHFGHAMAYVDWVSEIDGDVLLFANFFKDNESPDDRHKRQNAERQAAFRKKHGNDEVTQDRNVTVTPREEKRREEIDNSLRSLSKRATLNAPSEEHEAIASERGLSCQTEFAKYRDWQASTGKRHKDETAGFRNWLRNAKVPGRAEQQASNMDILTGKVRHGRSIAGIAGRMDSAVVLTLPSDLRESGTDDVEGRGPERSALGMG